MSSLPVACSQSLLGCRDSRVRAVNQLQYVAIATSFDSSSQERSFGRWFGERTAIHRYVLTLVVLSMSRAERTVASQTEGTVVVGLWAVGPPNPCSGREHRLVCKRHLSPALSVCYADGMVHEAVLLMSTCTSYWRGCLLSNGRFVFI
jgi:hypothetical protein